MRIQVFFHFKDDLQPSAVTGVEDGATDLLLPMQGDIVAHKDPQGANILGRVAERTFSYDIPAGVDVDGVVTVTLLLDRLVLQ